MNFFAKATRWKPVFIVLFAVLAALNLGVLWYGRGYMVQGYGDFTALYTAGKLLQRGEGHHLYDAKHQWEVQLEFASTVAIRRGPLPYIRPPFQAILFFPMAWLDYPHAFFVWMALKMSMLFLIPFLLRSHLVSVPLRFYWVISLLSLSVTWVTMDLLQGQDAILFLLICVLAFTAVSRGSDFLAGVWLGLGLFKFHIILTIILVLAIRRRWRILLGFQLVALCLLLISMALVGRETLLDYPQYLWSVSQNPGLGVIPANSMPTLRGSILRLSQAAEWHRVADWFYVPLAFVITAIAAMNWPANRDSNGPKELVVAGYSFSLLTAILVSFYFSGYDMMILLLPALLLTPSVLNSTRLAGWAKAIFVGALGFLLFVPVAWMLLLDLHLQRGETLALLLFYGVLAYAIRIWRREASLSQMPHTIS